MLVEDTTAFVEQLEVSTETRRSRRLQGRILDAEVALLKVHRDIRLAVSVLGEIDAALEASPSGRRARSLEKELELVGKHLETKRADLAACEQRLDRLREEAAESDASSAETFRLHSAGHCHGLSGRQFARLSGAQLVQPVLVMETGGRRWWWYLDRFWWGEAAVPARDVERLVLRADLERKVAADSTAEARAAIVGAGSMQKRASHPAEVQLTVWSRDRGRCVECGSARDVLFDDIISGSPPDASNVELRCRLCCDRRAHNETRTRVGNAQVDATPHQKYVA